ncbi:hypothetical protein A2533_01865 [Candidatus Falkowbacteria bacterium RIFOXYD2_FULL_35_9]|uniref:Uncharacterized protein n=1 Tax=Candidatus Falkowbacteria bacterium RIFOXYC2_FULL_36_12 TaxID=1798002 RepID=A0A1F5SZZ4_9BACT|nr:MAG: hypothetical protein A2300_01660 [Candidatus Falkowbacteria bacterium RIFOXYB2_FULL_35_7]OGF31791.1 MAG: hypothetical protein A2478_04890 [Candidatus Falkowbacteria bacterium RIFOXYC2_FULL_36_12]OGF33799.1 MAG: hypothetical protein A2223_00300 [Candidatus Falkowbacteria bacterium RIFOXYA2_FULL_35_8]OGF48250.1 MAG: hypothetical protein A2533_01865 [Candidatus Falkowbacteria bacterium RIFOXYD2_FULL_35_9]
MSKNFLIKGAVWGIILGTVGGYFFNQKTGKKNQEKVKKAAGKVAKRLTTELTAVKELSKKHYDEIVGKVMSDLKEDKSISSDAWQEISQDLKSRWTTINSEVKKYIKDTKKK